MIGELLKDADHARFKESTRLKGSAAAGSIAKELLLSVVLAQTSRLAGKLVKCTRRVVVGHCASLRTEEKDGCLLRQTSTPEKFTIVWHCLSPLLHGAVFRYDSGPAGRLDLLAP